MSDLIKRSDAIRALHKHFSSGFDADRWWNSTTVLFALNSVPSADIPQGEWIDCKEPPSTDRNVFIAYGTDDMKSVCIGHYEHGMKMWYEDKNFFAEPLYGGMYWCEIPQFPTRMKGADDEMR